MLICVGGLLGSGRKDFARRLGEKLDFYVFNLESSMRTTLFLREHQRESLHGYDLLSDPLRLRMFQHVARDFGQLAKTYRNIIVDESFHRHIPREFFFEEGKKHFTRVAVVWVEDTEASLEERVQRVLEKNPRHDAEGVKRMIKTMERDFEPFTLPPIVVRNVVQNPHVLKDVIQQLGM